MLIGMTHKVHRAGPTMLVTEEFREQLRQWVNQPGNSQSKLARAIGCDQSNISMLLNKPEDYKTSVWVEPICKATGIPLPTTLEVSETDTEILERLRHMRNTDAATYEAIAALLRARGHKDS